MENHHLGVIVPLYMWPGADWEIVLNAKLANPATPLIVILNPSSGPGDSYVESIGQWANKFSDSGAIVAGYVPTSYGYANLGSVMTSIDNYQKWYQVDGIFFDEVSTGAAFLDYYRALNSIVKSKGMKYCIGNPGQPVSSKYAEIFEFLVATEGPHLLSPSLVSDLAQSSPPGSLVGIMYAAPVLDQNYIDALSRSLGYIYSTEIGMPDPYRALPGYFANMFNMVERTNGGRSGEKNMISVLALDASGAPITGIPIRAESGKIGAIGGPSPFTFEAPGGDSVNIILDDRAPFDLWSSGERSRELNLRADQNRVVAAYCRPRRAESLYPPPGPKLLATTRGPANLGP